MSHKFKGLTVVLQGGGKKYKTIPFVDKAAAKKAAARKADAKKASTEKAAAEKLKSNG